MFTDSRPPGRRRPSLFSGSLALDGGLCDLFTELPELLTLLGSEPFAFSLIYLRLLYPTPKSVVRDAKFPGNLGGWFVCGRADQPNGLCFELWCIARCCSRHLWDSLRRRSRIRNSGVSTDRGQAHYSSYPYCP